MGDFQMEDQVSDSVLGEPTNEFVTEIKTKAKLHRNRVASELRHVRPGHPNYRRLKKAELRLRRIMKNCDEMVPQTRNARS